MNQDELDALLRPHGWGANTSAHKGMWLIDHRSNPIPQIQVINLLTLAGFEIPPLLISKHFFRVAIPRNP